MGRSKTHIPIGILLIALLATTGTFAQLSAAPVASAPVAAPVVAVAPTNISAPTKPRPDVYPVADKWNDGIGGATIAAGGAVALLLILGFFTMNEKYRPIIAAGIVTSFFSVLAPLSIMFTNDIRKMMGIILHDVMDYTVNPPVVVQDYYPWFLLVFFALARPVTFYCLQSVLTVGIKYKSSDQDRDPTLNQRFLGGLLFSAGFLTIFYGAGANDMGIRSVFIALGLAIIVGLVIYQLLLGVRIGWKLDRVLLFIIYVVAVVAHAAWVLFGTVWLGMMNFQQTIIFGLSLVILTDALFPVIVLIFARWTGLAQANYRPVGNKTDTFLGRE